MIVGTVDARRQSVVPLVMHGTSGQQETVETLLDTGFNGELMLPAARVTALGLIPRSSRVMRLADGSRVEVPLYEVILVWDGHERTASVLASGNQPLLGTGLLLGSSLRIEMRAGGRVTIEPL